MKDRAGNTLASARKLGSFDSKTLSLKDFVGSSDGNDLYTFSLGSSSSLKVNFSGAVAAELFTLKNRKAIKNIGKLDFSTLKRKDIRNNLIRVARSGNGVLQSSSALSAGNYYLRVRSLKPKANYTVELSSQTSTLVPISTGTTTLFSGIGLPKDQGWLDFNQIPTSAPFDKLPFLSKSAKTVAQTSDTTGATFRTDEDFTTTNNPNVGYAGYSNYTAKVNSVFPTLDVSSVKFNGAFPTLDRTTGYTLSFKLAVNSEVSDPNRAGFSIILTSEDTKGIELGFKGDRIFAQSSTFIEDEKATFSTNALTDYKLSVKGDGYELFANNNSILKGALRTYQFDPATSSPPLPASPYALPSFLFMGDDTDQGRANVTLGAIAINQG
jgi:hypothetical protein